MANEGRAAAASSALSILWAETILERSPEELENKLWPNQFYERPAQIPRALHIIQVSLHKLTSTWSHSIQDLWGNSKKEIMSRKGSTFWAMAVWQGKGKSYEVLPKSDWASNLTKCRHRKSRHWASRPVCCYVCWHDRGAHLAQILSFSHQRRKIP